MRMTARYSRVFVFHILKVGRKILPSSQGFRSGSREFFETLLQRSLIPTENWHDRRCDAFNFSDAFPRLPRHAISDDQAPSQMRAAPFWRPSHTFPFRVEHT